MNVYLVNNLMYYRMEYANNNAIQIIIWLMEIALFVMGIVELVMVLILMIVYHVMFLDIWNKKIV